MSAFSCVGGKSSRQQQQPRETTPSPKAWLISKFGLNGTKKDKTESTTDKPDKNGGGDNSKSLRRRISGSVKGVKRRLSRKGSSSSDEEEEEGAEWNYKQARLNEQQVVDELKPDIVDSAESKRHSGLIEQDLEKRNSLNDELKRRSSVVDTQTHLDLNWLERQINEIEEIEVQKRTSIRNSLRTSGLYAEPEIKEEEEPAEHHAEWERVDLLIIEDNPKPVEPASPSRIVEDEHNILDISEEPQGVPQEITQENQYLKVQSDIFNENTIEREISSLEQSLTNVYHEGIHVDNGEILVAETNIHTDEVIEGTVKDSVAEEHSISDAASLEFEHVNFEAETKASTNAELNSEPQTAKIQVHSNVNVDIEVDLHQANPGNYSESDSDIEQKVTTAKTGYLQKPSADSNCNTIDREIRELEALVPNGGPHQSVSEVEEVTEQEVPEIEVEPEELEVFEEVVEAVDAKDSFKSPNIDSEFCCVSLDPELCPVIADSTAKPKVAEVYIELEEVHPEVELKVDLEPKVDLDDSSEPSLDVENSVPEVKEQEKYIVSEEVTMNTEKVGRVIGEVDLVIQELKLFQKDRSDTEYENEIDEGTDPKKMLNEIQKKTVDQQELKEHKINQDKLAEIIKSIQEYEAYNQLPESPEDEDGFPQIKRIKRYTKDVPEQYVKMYEAMKQEYFDKEIDKKINEKILIVSNSPEDSETQSDVDVVQPMEVEEESDMDAIYDSNLNMLEEGERSDLEAMTVEMIIYIHMKLYNFIYFTYLLFYNLVIYFVLFQITVQVSEVSLSAFMYRTNL